MEQAQGGRINWRRFAMAVTIPMGVAAAIVVGVANGAIAAQFAVSGQIFKISADELDGTGFTQYGSGVKEADGTQHPVMASGIESAKLTKLCQSVKPPTLPFSLVIRAGGGNKKATATNMLIDKAALRGDATFTNIDIGQDASTLKKDGRPVGEHGAKGGFGQQADRVVITGLEQTAYSTSAGTFTLNGLSLKLEFPHDGKPAAECF